MAVILPELRTTRLTLKPAKAADAEDYIAFEERCAKLPEATRFLPRRPSMTLEDVRTRLAANEGAFTTQRSLATWFIRSPDDATIVGYAAFVRWNHDASCSEVAYVIGPHAWGQGLAGEATAALVRYAFTELGLHRVEARIDPKNHASIRVAEKIDFVHEETLRQNVRVEGGYLDSAVYARLNPDGT